MALSMNDIFEDMKARALRGEPPEELDDELAEYIEGDESSSLGQCIKHPLYYQMLYSPVMAPICNAQFRAKLEHVRRLRDEGNLSSAVWFYERPYRLQVMLELDKHAWNDKGGIGFTPKLYWETLASLWTDTENMWQNYDLWHRALHDERPCRWAFMTKAEREKLKTLRKRRTPVMIYRGYAHSGPDRGFSWTLSKARAKWFAERFAGVEHRDEPTLVSGLIDAENIIARLDGRGEEEIVALPEHVHVVKITSL